MAYASNSTVNYQARVSQKQKQSNQSTSKNKSVRRNREERLRSANSSKRQQQTEKSQTKPTTLAHKNKFSGLKNATNRVMPKVCGSSSNIVRHGQRSNNMMQKKLNLDNSGMASGQNFTTFDNNVSIEINAGREPPVPFPSRKQFNTRSSNKTNVYNSLNGDKASSIKNSFIESKVAKGSSGGNPDSKFELSNQNQDTRNFGPQVVSSSQGLSNKNTTTSDMNSDVSNANFIMANSAYPTISAKFDKKERVPRGKSVDTRRGRQSRNLERSQNKIEKNQIQDSQQQSTLTELKNKQFPINLTSNTSSGDKATSSTNSGKQTSIRSKMLNSNQPQVTECYLYTIPTSNSKSTANKNVNKSAKKESKVEKTSQFINILYSFTNEISYRNG